MTKTVFTNEYQGLIHWLKAERIEAGLTIRGLAEKLGVVHSYVGRIETFERRLDVWEYMEYCKALNLDPKKGIDILSQ
ncbi:MAG: helix-turn-helix domain-containing protein [Alphaproteobacteria bacterium]